MNQKEEAETYKQDLRKTIPLIIGKRIRANDTYQSLSPLEQVDKYLANFGAPIFTTNERAELRSFLEGKIDKVKPEIISPILMIFKGVEQFLPSVKIPKGVSEYVYSQIYFKAFILATS